MDDEDPSLYYIQQLLPAEDADDEPMVEYFDKEGNNVTPLPLHAPDDEEEAIMTLDPKKKGSLLRRPPKKNPIMKTLLHVTTALYSMAGLGSLEQSKAFKELSRSTASEGLKMSKKGKKKKALKELKVDGDEDDDEGEKGRIRAADGAVSSHLPDSMLAAKAMEIDILLVESETIWMLDLPGTCIEVDPDKLNEDGDEEVDEDVQDQEKNKKKDVSNYELIESWTQTLDFSKKKKGTQCDDIDVMDGTTQVSMKNFLDEEKKMLKRQRLESSTSPRSALPSVTDIDDSEDSAN